MYSMSAIAGWDCLLACKHLLKACRDLRKLKARIAPAVRAFFASLLPRLRPKLLTLLTISVLFNAFAVVHCLGGAVQSLRPPPESACVKPERAKDQVVNEKPEPRNPAELLSIVGRE